VTVALSAQSDVLLCHAGEPETLSWDGRAAPLPALTCLSVPVRESAALHPSRYGRMTDSDSQDHDR
jgi:hypothetical protein